VEVRIYSIAGRVVRVLKSTALLGRFIQVAWDGTDEQGDRLGNGIYLYKILMKNEQSAISQESIGKLAIVR
jgi:flagellar hook assembly protein FlgD